MYIPTQGDAILFRDLLTRPKVGNHVTTCNLARGVSMRARGKAADRMRSSRSPLPCQRACSSSLMTSVMLDAWMQTDTFVISRSYMSLFDDLFDRIISFRPAGQPFLHLSPFTSCSLLAGSGACLDGTTRDIQGNTVRAKCMSFIQRYLFSWFVVVQCRYAPLSL